jgi:hypothetical protein
MGPMPATVGIGYLSAEEMERKDVPKWWHKCRSQNGKAKPLFGFDPCPECGEKSFATPPVFGHAQHAMKRAEAHWWKQAADLPFAITPSGEGAADLDDVPITIAGTWKDVTPETLAAASPDQVEAHMEQVQQLEEHKAVQAAKTPEARKADAKAGSDALFGAGDPAPRSWPDADVTRVAKLWEGNGVMPPETHVKHVIMAMNLSPFGPDTPDGDWVIYGKAYRGRRDEGLSSKAASIQAKVDWEKATAPVPF